MNRFPAHPTLIAVFCLASAWCSAAVAQSDEGPFPIEDEAGIAISPPTPVLEQRLVPIQIDSGELNHRGRTAAIMFDEVIAVEGATWLRLRLSNVEIPRNATDAAGSYLQITSLEDGALQVLDAEALVQWNNTTAYFNGDAVRVELIAAPQSGRHQFTIDFAWGGVPSEPAAGGDDNDGRVLPLSICGSTDDRLPSDDPRSGRAMPVGCTAFIIDDANHCFLTAGHCASGGRLEVIQFNVPPSDSNGNVRHPPAEDQYPVDPASIQYVNGGQGNDWCYFGCFPNSITGLTPFQAQGDFYETADAPPVVDGRPIRITGYGVDSSPPERSQTQQTNAGPFYDHSGTRIQYRTDTTGGNSGSGVQDDTTGLIIGIHTHGGCSSGGGANSGTAINHAGLQDALANPRGVCRPGLAFSYPQGLPDNVDPRGTTTILVQVEGQNGGQPLPGSGLSYFDTGSGFDLVPMEDLGDHLYRATVPSSTCGTEVRFYFAAETTDGAVVSDPPNAPAGHYVTLSATEVIIAFEDDFQTDRGWTVRNENLAAGAWERGVPVGGGNRGDPPNDFDGSGACYLTGNASGDSDVDGGPTRLTSPIIDLSTATNPILNYARWFTNDDRDGDRLVAEISNDGGASWTLLESVPHDGVWTYQTFGIEDFLAVTSQMRLRFSVADNPNDSVTEAAVDAVRISTIVCATTELVDFTFLAGSLRSGSLDDLRRSDDSFMIARSEFGFTAFEANVTDLLVGAETSVDAATTIDLAVESRLNNPGGQARLRLRNWQTTDLDDVAQYAIGLTEMTFTVDDLPSTDRVRASDRRIELSIRQTVVATFAIVGFDSYYDWIQINAE